VFLTAALLASSLLVIVGGPRAGAQAVTQRNACFSPLTLQYATFPLPLTGTLPAVADLTPGQTVELTGVSTGISVSGALVAAGIGAGVISWVTSRDLIGTVDPASGKNGVNQVANTTTVRLEVSNASPTSVELTGSVTIRFFVVSDGGAMVQIFVEPAPGAWTGPADNARLVEVPAIPVQIPVGPGGDATQPVTLTADDSGQPIEVTQRLGPLPAGTAPTLAERAAAPIVMRNGLSDGVARPISADFFCWPGQSTGAPDPVTGLPASSTNFTPATAAEVIASTGEAQAPADGTPFDFVQAAACFSPVTRTWAPFDLAIGGVAPAGEPAAGDTVTVADVTLTVTVDSALIAAGVGAGVVQEGPNTVVSTVHLTLSATNTEEATQTVAGEASLTFDVTVDPATGAVTVDPDPVESVVALADSTWTATGGAIEISVRPGTPPPGEPTIDERNAAPIRILNRLNDALNADFFCWPDLEDPDGEEPITEEPITEEPVPVPPVTGTATYTTECRNNITPDVSTLTFEVTGTAPGKVQAGETVTLSDQHWKITVPGSVLDAGIGLGLIGAGDTLNGAVKVSVAATNTAEGTRESSPVPIEVGPIALDEATGTAQPVTAAFDVADMTWTTTGGTVAYRMAGAQVDMQIGAIAITFTCAPVDGTITIVETQVEGEAVVLPIVAEQPRVEGVTVATPAAPRDVLPETGYTTAVFLLLAVVLLDLGYLAWSTTQPARRPA
jgi:hypothetical protein